MPVKMLIINTNNANHPELDELNEFVNILCENNNNEVVYNSLAMIAVELLAAAPAPLPIAIEFVVFSLVREALPIAIELPAIALAI